VYDFKSSMRDGYRRRLWVSVVL